ncbi:hypothetical protein [Argonema galeatum]|uniref:hypothetical protein n=1 Tax=Argonema galeatum TaxID=2942762 RepID=UPI0020113B07|nr:hypothetical protein [Argonema galeatum]MCL1465443.1 hypothetical protein [Argonema galeatum A003/A1]
MKRLVAHKTILLYAPEGVRGPGKGWFERFQLQTFHPSFISLSDRYQIPILPVVCLGNEYLHPWAFNLQKLAKTFSLPFLPLSVLIIIFILFPSMGVWAMKTRLRYYIQPLDLPSSENSQQQKAALHNNRSTAYQRAQAFREKLQKQINSLLIAEKKG